MAERIRTIQHRWRLGAKRAQRASAGEQIPHETLPARNQLVGEHEPRSGLDASLTQRRRQLGRAFGAYVEVVLQHDSLTVEQKARTVGRRIVQHLIDQGDETLPKSLGRMIPLAIPVGVGDYVDGEQDRSAKRKEEIR